jgi:cellulose synthase/poly-beta-1,6-N-acetylglucosamine synthase-like glycosyltransferase
MTYLSLPNISIVVTTFNNEKTIGACLKSIFELNYPKELIDVFVIDGCSKDKTTAIAKKYPVKLIIKSLNAPAAYNYAIKIVDSSIIGFIDSDAKVEREWLNKLVAKLDNPQVAGVSGSIETWNKENLWARSIGYDLISRYDRIKKPVVRIATMNLLMKKNILEEVGGFDENLPSQYDTDLGFRISTRGYKMLLDSKAKCYHYNRSSLKSYFNQQLQYGKNTIKLYFKHHELIKGDEITDIGMNIQPPMLLSSVFFFIIGLVDFLRPLWLISIILLVSLLIYFVFSAIKLSIRFSDNTALLLIILYFVRVIAWSSGAVISTIKYVLGKRDEK